MDLDNIEINSWQDVESLYADAKKEYKWPIRIGAAVVGGLTLVCGGLSSCYTVAQDEEAVVRRIGAYSHSASPGLNFKMPWLWGKRIH